MSGDNLERKIEFIIEQQAKFSADIDELKEVQRQQAKNIDSLINEMREGFENLIIANEVTRKLSEDVARLTIQNSQRITALEEKAS